MGKSVVFLPDFEELKFENFDDIAIILYGLGHLNIIGRWKRMKLNN